MDYDYALPYYYGFFWELFNVILFSLFLSFKYHTHVSFSSSQKFVLTFAVLYIQLHVSRCSPRQDGYVSTSAPGWIARWNSLAEEGPGSMT